MKRMISVICCCILFLILGCKKDDSILQPTSFSNTIFPLAVGNTWNFTQHSYDSTGTITSSESLSYVIVRDTIINNSKWYMLWGSLFLLANRDSGLYEYLNAGQKLFYKYPANAQDSFYISATYGYLHVKSINISITVPAGTFNCYAYESYIPIAGATEIDYLCPGVGMIKIENYQSAPNSRTQYLSGTSELLSFVLK